MVLPSSESDKWKSYMAGAPKVARPASRGGWLEFDPTAAQGAASAVAASAAGVADALQGAFQGLNPFQGPSLAAPNDAGSKASGAVGVAPPEAPAPGEGTPQKGDIRTLTLPNGIVSLRC